MPRPTPRRSPAPSQFPNTSVNQFNRRRLIAGAGAALGAGAILGGLGSAGVSALSRTSTGRLLQSSSDPVTFGSNYSDAVPTARHSLRRSRPPACRPRSTRSTTTPYQENFNTYIQQPDDLMSWFAGYRMRAFANRGVVGDSATCGRASTGFSEGFKNASTALDGKQYFVPFYYYPWAVTTGRARSRRRLRDPRRRGTSSSPSSTRCRPTGSRRSPPPTTATGRRWACSTCSTCGSTATTSTSR